MLNTLISTLLYCLIITPAALASGTDDNIIIPGERIGMITKDTSEDDLKNNLPLDQIKRIVIQNDEGGFYCATEVFPHTEKAVVITWVGNQDSYLLDEKAALAKCETDPSRVTPEFVELKTCLWWQLQDHSQEDSKVGYGMNLTQLERVNRSPVTFQSCECCGDGYVDWNHGKFDEGANVGSNISPLFIARVNYHEVYDTIEKIRDSGEVASKNLSTKIKQRITVDKIIMSFK